MIKLNLSYLTQTHTHTLIYREIGKKKSIWINIYLYIESIYIVFTTTNNNSHIYIISCGLVYILRIKREKEEEERMAS